LLMKDNVNVGFFLGFIVTAFVALYINYSINNNFTNIVPYAIVIIGCIFFIMFRTLYKLQKNCEEKIDFESTGGKFIDCAHGKTKVIRGYRSQHGKSQLICYPAACFQKGNLVAILYQEDKLRTPEIIGIGTVININNEYGTESQNKYFNVDITMVENEDLKRQLEDNDVEIVKKTFAVSNFEMEFMPMLKEVVL